MTTRFSIQVPAESAAEDLPYEIVEANSTENAMADIDWSGEWEISVTPAMTTPDVAITVVLVPILLEEGVDGCEVGVEGEEFE